jgi:hypothetical protein
MGQAFDRSQGQGADQPVALSSWAAPLTPDAVRKQRVKVRVMPCSQGPALGEAQL